MKRDMDLIRKILQAIETYPVPDDFIELTIEGYESENIAYHVKLLAEAGLIHAINLSSLNGFEWKPKSLTWEGHEFLDASRDNSRWERIKRLVVEKTGGLSFEVLKAALVQAMLHSIS
jgi:hypothetical protein